jgi:VanZ family protein
MRFDNKYLILPVSFTVLIYLLSAIPEGMLVKIINSLPFIIVIKSWVHAHTHVKSSELMEITQNLLHMPFFAILTFLWFEWFRKAKTAFIKTLVYTFVIVFLIASFDEILQIFIPSRTASISDVGLDMIGYVFGFICYTIQKIKKCQLNHW